MSRRIVSRVGSGLLLVAVAAALVAGGPLVHGQEEQAAPAKTAPKKPRARPRGILPAYYKNVVTGTQRERIYQIQAKYRVEIDELLSQLAALKEKQNAEVDAVLSPEQKAQVVKLRAEAKIQRAKRAAERKAAAAKTGDAAPKTATGGDGS